MTEDRAIIRGTNDKPVASNALAGFFSEKPWFRGQLLLGYPIIGTPGGKHAIDAIWVTPDRGVIIFDLIEGVAPGDYSIRQDDAANKLEARLKTHKELMMRRNLLINIHTVSVAPAISDPSKFAETGYDLVNLESLQEVIGRIEWPNADKSVYRATLSAIQSISTIRSSRTRRVVEREDSRGAKLKRLEGAIATLDSLQGKAVLETVNGVQRIRGLAGSGKTIILALKAAYLHAQHPSWRIAVTFNTRSLKGQFRRLINNFSVEQAGEEPDWDSLRIVNAWGAPGGSDRDGIYHEFCRSHGIEYLDYRAAKNLYGQGKAFSKVCEKAIEQRRKERPLYDVILVDEAQDFPPSFLRLCYEMLDRHKRLVYAYDELQNLSGESLPPPEEIFGKQIDGAPRVILNGGGRDEPRRDIILEKCYRNSRPVLTTAHALGFGIYRNPEKSGSTGLVQMFDYSKLWEDIGYEVKQGELKDGKAVVLRRTTETSPSFLEDHSSLGDLVQFHRFESEDEQARWLVQEIKNNLDKEELRHDDLVVINPDPLTTRKKTGPARRLLLELGINSHLAGVDTDPDIFFRSDSASVTFTGIFRAKGNEAGMIYIINAQECHSSAWNLSTIRNRLFTAITRSKAWVRVLGVGDGMTKLTEEYNKLKKNNFELSFTYPTEEQRNHLQIVHRDITPTQRRLLDDRQRNLFALISDIDSGNVHPEDLDEGLIGRLEEIFANRRGG